MNIGAIKIFTLLYKLYCYYQGSEVIVYIIVYVNKYQKMANMH